MSIGHLLQKVYYLRRRVNSEETYLRKSLRRHALPGHTLLEVGCGFCRFHPIVASAGLEYIGIDVNPEIVRVNRDRGIHCLEANSFLQTPRHADVLLLSHIIEHFSYDTLVEMFNTYLPILRPRGLLVIFTPLNHRGFFDDFDHVKPYNPNALRQALCASSAQTQGFGVKGTYEEVGIWFKRDSLWHCHDNRRWMHVVKLPLSLLSTFTSCRIGRLTGYGMLLRKTGD